MAIKISGTTVIHNNRAANNFTHIKTSGFISASGNVSANAFIGDGSQLTNAGSTVASDTSANRELLVPFTGISSGTMTSANVNSNFTFNPATGALSANAFIGDGSQLTNAGSTVASDTSANRELLVPFTGISSGTMTSANVNSNFTFNPATGALSANAFIGDGSQLTNAGSTVATDTAANRELQVAFTGISSGTMTSANVNPNFTFNPATGALSANAFIGDGSQLTNAGSTVATQTGANVVLQVVFTGIASGTMTTANVNSTLTFNPHEGKLSANTVKTYDLQDSSGRTLVIRNSANSIVWGG